MLCGVLSKFPKSRIQTCDIGRSRPHISRKGPKLSDSAPNLADVGQGSVDVGPYLVKVEIGRSRSNIGRNRANIGRLRAKLVRSPHLGEDEEGAAQSCVWGHARPRPQAPPRRAPSASTQAQPCGCVRARARARRARGEWRQIRALRRDRDGERRGRPVRAVQDIDVGAASCAGRETSGCGGHRYEQTMINARQRSHTHAPL